MTGGTISGNGSQGVYAISAQAINLGDSAVIAADNDIQLGNGKTITITSSLTGYAPVATISPFNYIAGLQVLSAGNGVSLADEVDEFEVVAIGNVYWSIDATGQLVQKDSKVDVLSAIQNGSSSELVLYNDVTSPDDLKDIFVALRDNSSGYFTLDLSRTTLTSFSVDGVVLADWNGVASLKKIIFPATLTSIDLSSNNPFSGIYYENLIVVFRDTTSSWTSDSGSEFEPKVDGSVDSSHFVSGSPRWTKLVSP